jgi:hypothetical protein
MTPAPSLANCTSLNCNSSRVRPSRSCIVANKSFKTKLAFGRSLWWRDQQMHAAACTLSQSIHVFINALQCLHPWTRPETYLEHWSSRRKILGLLQHGIKSLKVLLSRFAKAVRTSVVRVSNAPNAEGVLGKVCQRPASRYVVKVRAQHQQIVARRPRSVSGE